MRRSVEIAPDGPRPPISLRPVPTCEPPFDDELEPTVWATAHQLTLDWSALSPVTAHTTPHAAVGATASPWVAGGTASPQALPGGTAPHALPGTASPHAPGGTAPHTLPGTAPRHALPHGAAPPPWIAGAASPPQRPAVAGASAEAKHAVARFVRTCIEVLNGYRPAAHMRRLAVPTEATAIVAQIMATAHRVTEMRRRMQSPAKRPSRRPLPVALVRLRLCEPRPGAVEAAFALVLGDRTWAMALRMEERQQSWSATTLRLV